MNTIFSYKAVSSSLLIILTNSFDKVTVLEKYLEANNVFDMEYMEGFLNIFLYSTHGNLGISLRIADGPRNSLELVLEYELEIEGIIIV